MNNMEFNPNAISLNSLANDPFQGQSFASYSNNQAPQADGNWFSKMGSGVNNAIGTMGRAISNFGPVLAQQIPQQPAMTMPQGNNNMDAYRMMAQGLQGIGRGIQQNFPSPNTAQIMRDQSRPQFAGYLGSPQQQMAQALRNRG